MRPSGAKRTAVGFVRPVITGVSWKGGRTSARALPPETQNAIASAASAAQQRSESRIAHPIDDRSTPIGTRLFVLVVTGRALR